MLDLKLVEDGTVFGGENGAGVQFVDCVYDETNNGTGKLRFRCKVSCQLTGKMKDPERDDDFNMIDDDFVDVEEWVPSDKGDAQKYKNSISRTNKLLSFLSGVQLDPEDGEAWMRAVTSDGDVNKGIVSNVANVYVVKRTENGYHKAKFLQDTVLDKKPTLEEFKAKFLAKKQAQPSAF